MSMHKIPLTELEREGLNRHHLIVDAPSQLSDGFRLGMKWAQDNASKDGWISVEDELPQEDFQVIACCDDDVEACIFRMHDTGNYYFERVDGEFRLEATHWMSLPNPPKAALCGE